MISRLSHSTIYVLDQDKARDFYVNVLGFSVHTDMLMPNGFRWLSVHARGHAENQIVLYGIETADAEMKAHLKPLLEANKMGAGVFETDDIDSTFRDLKAKGVTFLKEPTHEFYAIEALFLDGCGNWFSLTEHRANGA